MVLYPLAVVLLAQVGILMLVIIIYQRLQKKRLLKELENAQSQPAAQEPLLESDLGDSAFDKEQAALLLNRINQNTQDIISEAPAAKALGQHQTELVTALSECLEINLEQSQPATSINPKEDKQESDEILSQEELDQVLGEGADSLEGLEDLDTLEGLDDELDLSETDPEQYDPLIASEKVDEQAEEELPEDTLQQTLDNLDDFDFSDLEEELLKEDDKR